MDFNFSPYKIAEMAISVEEEGAKFYTLLSNSADSEKLKNVFSTLAKAELMHQNRFRDRTSVDRIRQ